MSRAVHELLGEAVTHLDAIHRHLARRSMDDETVADAVALRLSALIETLKRGEPELTTELFGGEWAVIWGMRNRIAHGYAWIDLDTVRATIDEDLPDLERRVRTRHGETSPPVSAPGD